MQALCLHNCFIVALTMPVMPGQHTYSPIHRPPGEEPDDRPWVAGLNLPPGVYCSHQRVADSGVGLSEPQIEAKAPHTPVPFPPVPSGAAINKTKYNDMMRRSIDEMNSSLDDGEPPFTPESYEAFQLSFGAEKSPPPSTNGKRKARQVVRPVKRGQPDFEPEHGSSSESPRPESYIV